MVKHIYIPIVKGKLNDLVALGKLAPNVRNMMKPLIELPPAPQSRAVSVEHHLAKFILNLKKSGDVGSAFVDFYGFFPGEVNASGVPAPIAGYEILHSEGRHVTPVYGFGRDDDLWKDLGAVVARHKRGFCFRLEEDDLEDDVAEETWDSILRRSADVGLGLERVDLVLDLRDVRLESVDEKVTLITDFMSFQPAGANFRSIAVSGSSALKDVSSLKKDHVGTVARNELKIWAKLASDLTIGTDLLYSDYGIIHPDFAADEMPVGGTANCKIRYTAGDSILVFRGHKRAGDSGQPFGLAEQVRSHPKYCGSDYSFGDEYIDMVADRTKGPGNLGSWVQADMNHHLTFALIQMEHLLTSISADQTEEDTASLLDELV